MTADGRRRVFWLLVAIWAGASWFIGERLADDMRFRVNNLAAIPGAGLIGRDPEGNFHHIRADGRSRVIFRSTDPKRQPDAPAYLGTCVDCAIVSGEQMSQTNEFCASGIRRELPELRFENPCRTWAPMGEGHRVMWFVVFALPLLLIPIGRALLRPMRRA